MIISGASAWAWLRTPPVVRDIEIPFDLAVLPAPAGAGIPERMLRGDARDGEEVAAIRRRLLGDLKGIEPPVEVVVPFTGGSRESEILTRRRTRRRIAPEALIDIGAGLSVAGPALAMAHVAQDMSEVALIQMLYEACGLYACFEPTPLARLVLDALVRDGIIAQMVARGPVAVAAFEADGARSFYGDVSDGDGWAPSLDRFGRLADLWKRPPICTVDGLIHVLGRLTGMHGARRVRRALTHVRDGSGSPLETSKVMICCLPPDLGGEGWPFPTLNKRIVFNEEARRLARATGCVADLLWEEQRVDVEPNGIAYHAGREGLERSMQRRAALEQMGYTQFDVSYEQMCDPEQLDLVLGLLSDRLGYRLQPRTRAFCQRREALLQELFGKTQGATSKIGR